MSESCFSKEGCWVSVAAFVLVILVVYMIVDLIADRQDAYYIKNLQQRVSILEAEQ